MAVALTEPETEGRAGTVEGSDEHTEHTESQLLELQLWEPLPSAGASATKEDEPVGSKDLDEQTSPA